jgi:hypothetical protein
MAVAAAAPAVTEITSPSMSSWVGAAPALSDDQGGVGQSSSPAPIRIAASNMPAQVEEMGASSSEKGSAKQSNAKGSGVVDAGRRIQQQEPQQQLTSEEVVELKAFAQGKVRDGYPEAC